MRLRSVVIIVLVLLTAIFILFEFYGYNAFFQPISIQKTDPVMEDLANSGELDLKINGAHITAQDVNREYDKLTDNARMNATKGQVLESMVTRLLLLQEADSKGIRSNENDVDAYLATLSGKNESVPDQQPAAAGSTLEEYRNNIKDFLTINKLLVQELNLTYVQITYSEVNNLIEKNKDDYQDIFNERNPQLEDMLRSRIKQRLMLEKQQMIVEKYVVSLREKAQIAVGGGI